MTQIQEGLANSAQHKTPSRDSEPLLGPFLGIPRKARANPWLWACGVAWLVVFGLGIYLGVRP